MTRYLVATAAAATTEAACEYRREKLESDDAVFVLTAEVPEEPDDRRAALDTAQVELIAVVDVRTFRRGSDPGREIVNFVEEHDIDEIIIGPARTDDISTIGSTTRVVLNSVDEPVFVLPTESP